MWCLAFKKIFNFFHYHTITFIVYNFTFATCFINYFLLLINIILWKKYKIKWNILPWIFLGTLNVKWDIMCDFYFAYLLFCYPTLWCCCEIMKIHVAIMIYLITMHNRHTYYFIEHDCIKNSQNLFKFVMCPKLSPFNYV